MKAVRGHRLSAHEIRKIRSRRRNGDNIYDIASDFKVSPKTVSYHTVGMRGPNRSPRAATAAQTNRITAIISLSTQLFDSLRTMKGIDVLDHSPE